MQPTGISRPSRRRINLLWVLAAILGIASTHSAMRAIHHPEPSRELMAHFAGVTAHYAQSVAERRLEATARELFAPVTRWSPGPLAPQAVMQALATGAREAERCRCGPALPILEFFRIDPHSKPLMRRPIRDGGAVALPDSMLRSHADQSLGLHFVSDSTGADLAILTSAQIDSSGAPGATYGLVTEARAMVNLLFGGEAAGETIRDSRSSLEVGLTEGTPLFETEGPPLRYHTTIKPDGPLSELSITAGLNAPSGMALTIRGISQQDLWLSAVLMVATALVIVIAAASSSREALLARARSDFIAGVSHELRMPLAQILLASETLAMEREQNPQAQKGLANSIVREARRLAGLVDNVLLVARSGAVKLHPLLGSVDVAALLAEVAESVQLAVEDAGQRLLVMPAPGLSVLGDRQLLRQALVNLLDNAQKYGAPGQTIRLGAEAAPKGSIHLYVEDEGAGIPAAERARLFEPYERLARDQTSERTGSGLGLSVVAQIARASRGKVWIEDGRPQGSRAVLELQSAAPSPES